MIAAPSIWIPRRPRVADVLARWMADGKRWLNASGQQILDAYGRVVICDNCDCPPTCAPLQSVRHTFAGITSCYASCTALDSGASQLVEIDPNYTYAWHDIGLDDGSTGYCASAGSDLIAVLAGDNILPVARRRYWNAPNNTCSGTADIDWVMTYLRIVTCFDTVTCKIKAVSFTCLTGASESEAIILFDSGIVSADFGDAIPNAIPACTTASTGPATNSGTVTLEYTSPA